MIIGGMRFGTKRLDEAARILAQALEQEGMFPTVSAAGYSGAETETAADFAAAQTVGEKGFLFRDAGEKSTAPGEEDTPAAGRVGTEQTRNQTSLQPGPVSLRLTPEPAEASPAADAESFSDRLMRDSRRYDAGFERY